MSLLVRSKIAPAGKARELPGSVFVITAHELGPKALHALRRRRKKKA
jgi:hypothetical protein